MKVFLDDMREPTDCLMYMHKRIQNLNLLYLDDWVIVRNHDEFVKVVSEHYEEITHISFDHDLADTHYTPEHLWDDYAASKDWQDQQVHIEKTGYECAVWLKSFYLDKGKKLPVMFVHSMNPVGTDKIVNLFL